MSKKYRLLETTLKRSCSYVWGVGGHAAWLEGSQLPDQALNLGPAVKAQSPAALDSQGSPSIAKMPWPPEREPMPGPPEHPLPSSSRSSRLLPWWPVPQNPPSPCVSHALSSALRSHLPDLGPARLPLSHPGADTSQEVVCPPRGKHTLNFMMALGGLHPPEAYS